MSTAQVQDLLGFTTRYELDGLLKRHGIDWEYTPEELHAEAEASRRLQQQRGVSEASR